MTSKEFNEKYILYLEKGFRGLEFDIPTVTKYLDKVFEDLTQLPEFKYKQIKLKFGMPRVYTSLNQNVNSVIEDQITELMK